MNPESVNDMMVAIRQIARDELGHDLRAAWGYVETFDPATYTVTVRLPTYVDSATTVTIVTQPIPLGTPYCGANYGLEVYPETGTPCLVYFVDKISGSACGAVLLHNTAFPAFGGLQPGEMQLITKGGAIIYGKQDGTLSLKSGGISNIVTQDGSTPVAVEGSTVTHDHSLDLYNTAIAAAITALESTVPPIPDVTTLLPLLADIFTAQVTLASTDIAGNVAAGAATHAAVDGGQGAQNLRAPGPGGS